MRRFSLIGAGVMVAIGGAVAQTRLAVVNTQKVLEAMPEFQRAQRTIDSLAESWRKEIEHKRQQLDYEWKKYRQERYLLSESMRQEQEDKLRRMEEEIRQMHRERFGPEGELFKKRQELIQPLQDRVYQAIEQLANEQRFAVVLDASYTPAVLYYSPAVDITDEVMKKLQLR